MIRIVCTSCQKTLSLDETKLPMKEVALPCPVCKTRLTVDRRTFASEAAAPAGEAAAPEPASPAENHQEDHHEGHDAGFGEKALLVGADDPAIRQALKLVGSIPVYFAAADKARDFYNQEYPHVVVLHPAQMTPPPLQEMQPIVALAPADRRKSFLILVADGLRTLDGNAAFLYGVNLIVAARDLPQFPQIYRDAMAYHERLYASYTSVTKIANA